MYRKEKRWFLKQKISSGPPLLPWPICPYDPSFCIHNSPRNALKMSWGKTNFVNPPYSNVKPWIEKAHQERIRGNTSVLLLKTDCIATSYFQLYCNQCELRFFSHKIRFVGYPAPARFTSMLVILRPEHKQNSFKIIDFRPRVSKIYNFILMII